MTSRRRHFGTVRKLPSGRWQARYYDHAGRRHTAPRTFPAKADAFAYLPPWRRTSTGKPG